MAQEQAEKDFERRQPAAKPRRGVKYSDWVQSENANANEDGAGITADIDNFPPPLRLVDLLRDVARARYAILAGMILGAVCAFVFCAAAVPHYKALAVLSPAQPMAGGGPDLSGIPDGAAALSLFMQYAGLGRSSAFERFETMARGQAVAAQLLEDPRIPHGLERDRAFLFSRAEPPKNAAELSEYLRRRVHFEHVSGGGLRQMSYSHPDPDFAAYLQERIQAITDRMIRESLRRETAGRIAYLREQMTGAAHPDHRRTLTALLLEQERLRMLASIDQPYAAEIVEPPAASSRPRWPDRSLVFAALILAGAFAGFILHESRRAYGQS